MALTAGTPVTLDANQCFSLRITEVDTGIGIAAYRDSVDNAAEVRVVDITGGSPSVGASATVDSNDPPSVDIDKLETNKAFVVVGDSGASGYVKGAVATRSGSTVSVGTLSSAAETADVREASCSVVSASKALVAWHTGTQFGGSGELAHFTVSGTTVTPGSVINMTNRVLPVANCALNSQYHLVFGKKASDDSATFLLVDVSGTNPSEADSASALSDLMDNTQGDIAALSDTAAIATWQSATVDGSYAVIVTRSGSSISVGTPQIINSGTLIDYTTIVAPTSTEAVHFDDGDVAGGQGTVTRLTISGSTITVTADTDTFGTGFLHAGSAILSSTNVVACYDDGGGEAVLITGAPAAAFTGYGLTFSGGGIPGSIKVA